MIPKIIHYCWFGGNQKSLLAQKCIKSWEKYCSDYIIFEWNELNYDTNSAPLYVQQAYHAGKWAFVADYVRLQVVYENGGIYLDTDVELIKKPDNLLKYSAYFGFEGIDYINTGLGFGSEKENPILVELMRDYEKISFILEDGSLDVTPCPFRNTNVFIRRGLKRDGTLQRLEGDILILSAEYLCPLDNATRVLHKTKNTISIHHFNASWQTVEQRKKHDKLARQRRINIQRERIVYFPRWMMRKIMGDKRYEKLKKKIKKNEKK